jgi:hypothetical protein
MVHDAFGHAVERTDFSPAGEESAWNLHRQLFSPEARPALATETRGQAAYTYKYGDFPPQKATILPEHLQVRPEDLETGKSTPSAPQPRRSELGGGPVFAKMRETLGETDDPTPIKGGASFISPEGTYVHLPTGTQHPDAIKWFGGESSEGGNEVRPDFLKESGTVRLRQSKGRAGETLQVSVPPQGVNEAQVDAIRKAVAVNGREGNVLMERSDVSPETKDALTTYKEFAKPTDVGSMLKAISAHPDTNRSELGGKEEPAKYPENPEGFGHIRPDLLEHMEPDEKEFVKGSKSKQKAIEKAYDNIIPSIEETKAAIQAGHALGGWWQRFIDTFKALGQTDEAAQIEKLGPEHAEALKAWHSAVSGNKSVEDANRTAWGTYADWLDAGRPKDRATINKIVAANGEPKGNAAISDTTRGGKLIHAGLDTTKLYNLINSPQMRDVNPEPFHGSIYDPNNPSPIAGVTNGARKIPSMGATVAGEGNLNRLVLDAHMLDFYGINKWTDNKYIAHSIHLRKAAAELGLKGGEGQEQIWGTVLGIKKLLNEGVPAKEIPDELSNDTIESIGKDYAQIIKEDPELYAIFNQLKKHGLDPGGNAAQQRLADIAANKRAVKEEGANKDLLAHTAERIKGRMKKLPEELNTSFDFGHNKRSNLSGEPAQTPTPVTYTVPEGWTQTGPAKAPGMITPGNINLTTRPVVKNDDGSHSSEYSVSMEDDKGHEVLVPTVVDGKFLTPDGKKPKPGSPEEKAMFQRAWQHYEQTGQHLGIFDNPDHADAVAQQIHNRKPVK